MGSTVVLPLEGSQGRGGRGRGARGGTGTVAGKGQEGRQETNSVANQDVERIGLRGASFKLQG